MYVPDLVAMDGLKVCLDPCTRPAFFGRTVSSSSGNSDTNEQLQETTR